MKTTTIDASYTRTVPGSTCPDAVEQAPPGIEEMARRMKALLENSNDGGPAPQQEPLPPPGQALTPLCGWGLAANKPETVSPVRTCASGVEEVGAAISTGNAPAAVASAVPSAGASAGASAAPSGGASASAASDAGAASGAGPASDADPASDAEGTSAEADTEADAQLCEAQESQPGTGISTSSAQALQGLILKRKRMQRAQADQRIEKEITKAAAHHHSSSGAQAKDPLAIVGSVQPVTPTARATQAPMEQALVQPDTAIAGADVPRTCGDMPGAPPDSQTSSTATLPEDAAPAYQAAHPLNVRLELRREDEVAFEQAAVHAAQQIVIAQENAPESLPIETVRSI